MNHLSGSRWMAVATALFLLLPASSFGVTLLTLENPGSATYQQTQNSPCVIGDPSCQNPVGFDSTLIPSNTADYTLSSPTYTVQQIRNLVGNVFFVGIDVNTTTSPLATEVLNSFTLAINNVTQFSYTGPTQLVNNNNGNGRSDELLKNFNLSGFNPTDTAVFTASISNATDGREEFFLITSTASPVPEPASIVLFGTLLVGAAAWQRRRFARSL